MNNEERYITFCEKTVVGIELGDNCKKAVHFCGFGYCAEDETDTPYRFLEYTGFVASLSDVKNVGFTSYESDYGERYSQYVCDCTAEEMFYIYNHYDNGNQPSVIKEEDITEDTPCGIYIVIPKKE